jgi:hypothetical protein
MPGSCAILFGVIPLFAGHQFEACVPPPCTFCLANDSSKKGSNIEFNLYPRRVECILDWSYEAHDLLLGRRCPICGSTLHWSSDSFVSEVRFFRLILMVIFAFVFVVPRKHANHEFSALAIRAFFVPSDQLPIGGGLHYVSQAYYAIGILRFRAPIPTLHFEDHCPSLAKRARTRY